MAARDRTFLRELAAKLEPMGWTPAGLTRRGHIKWLHPRAPAPLITPSTSTCRHALANSVADARRALRQAGDSNRQA
jgi:hypothetical protein